MTSSSTTADGAGRRWAPFVFGLAAPATVVGTAMGRRGGGARALLLLTCLVGGYLIPRVPVIRRR